MVKEQFMTSACAMHNYIKCALSSKPWKVNATSGMSSARVEHIQVKR